MNPAGPESASQGVLPDSAFRAAVDAMAEGVVVHDLSGAIVAANAAAERILALPLAVMQGRHPIDPSWRLIRPDGVPLEPDAIPSEITLRTGVPCRDVLLGVRRQGAPPTWLSVSTAPFGDGAGRAGVVATFLDVTELVEANRAVEAGRSFLQQITAEVPGALYQFLVASDGRESFPYVSPQSDRVLGVAGEALVADPNRVWERIHPDDLPRVRGAIEATVRRIVAADPAPDADVFRAEFRFAREPGRWGWLEARSRGAITPGGILFHGLVHDVTERHALGEQIQVAQRQEVIGLLASGIAHNFNNMLTAIVPNLELALEQVSEDVRPLIDDAHRAALSASELVRQLLLLVRRDESRPGERAELVEVVRGALRICRRTFDRRFQIVEALPEPPVRCRGSRGAMEQVILNLCLNARDALETVADPRIRVGLAVDRTAGTATIEIADNGVGMSPEQLRRIGEPFYTTKAPGRGTGLGLTSAIGIVHDQGGTIDFRSLPGQGTTVTIGLPIVGTEESEPPEPALAERRPIPPGTALVIDDESMVRATAARLLRRAGFQVIEADTGPAGLERAARHPEITVALVDLSMPGMSGAEVLAALKARRPTLPVVISSGNVGDPAALRAADAILPKPFRAGDLMDALRRLSSGAGQPPP